MTRLDKCVEAVRLAYLSHVPIIWIVTPEMEFAYSVARKFSEEHFAAEEISNKELGVLSNFITPDIKESDVKRPQISFDWLPSSNITEGKTPFDTPPFLHLVEVVNRHQRLNPESPSGYKETPNPTNNCAIIASPFPPQAVKAGWLNHYIETIYVTPLSDEEIKEIIGSFFTTNHIQGVDSSFEDQLIVNFRGVSERKILVLLNRCKVAELFDIFNEDNRNKILSEIRSLKRQMLDGFTGLKWVPVDESTTPAAGLGAITNWLKKRKEIFSDPETKAKEGYDIPKGLLITGIPGSGKSLMAKETAKILNLPLIAMDLGDLQEGLVGKSEEHMATALRMVDAMAPCVLWIDEIEKAFSGASSGQSDGGVMRRLFGKFLTWMQEKTSFCFVFATSNDISQLPPELFRSERFDEKFYSFMPTVEECAEIFVANINYQNKLFSAENKDTSILFDGMLAKKKYWIDLLNESATRNFKKDDSSLPDEVELTDDQCRDGYKPQIKLFTGADISSFVKLLKFVILQGRKNPKSSNHDCQGPITKREVDHYIWGALKDFMPYGQTNLNDIAKCFFSLAKNRFKSASQVDGANLIISFDDYDEEKETMKYDSDRFKDEKDAYNRTLYRCVVGAINHMASKKNNSN